MPIVEAEIEVAAGQDDVFDLTQDYALRLRWDPFLSALEFRDGARTAQVGTKVWVRARNGLTMVAVYVAYDRPRAAAIKMTAGPRMFERFAGSWRFEPLGPERTRVTFRYGFETRWPWLRPVLDRAIALVFARDIRLRLAGLKRGAEQGELLAVLRAARAANAG